MHTLTHNPLQDYYCYYCFHHKVYCQYCHYAPSQLYYAMFYTGYYSQYYTNYYASAFNVPTHTHRVTDTDSFAEAMGLPPERHP